MASTFTPDTFDPAFPAVGSGSTFGSSPGDVSLADSAAAGSSPAVGTVSPPVQPTTTTTGTTSPMFVNPAAFESGTTTSNNQVTTVNFDSPDDGTTPATPAAAPTSPVASTLSQDPFDPTFVRPSDTAAAAGPSASPDGLTLHTDQAAASAGLLVAPLAMISDTLPILLGGGNGAGVASASAAGPVALSLTGPEAMHTGAAAASSASPSLLAVSLDLSSLRI